MPTNSHMKTWIYCRADLCHTPPYSCMHSKVLRNFLEHTKAICQAKAIWIILYQAVFLKLWEVLRHPHTYEEWRGWIDRREVMSRQE